MIAKRDIHFTLPNPNGYLLIYGITDTTKHPCIECADDGEERAIEQTKTRFDADLPN